MTRIIITFFILGLSFGAGPCVASCGPILISYIAGTKKNSLGGLTVYALFSLARISVYLILSLVVFFLGRFAIERILGSSSRWLFIAGGVFIIFLGALVAIGKSLDFKFCRFFGRHFLERDIKSVFILGLVIGLAPCAPLFAILSYIGFAAKTWWQGLLYGLSFGLGTFISPLIILVAMAGLIPKLFMHKKEIYSRYFNFICGLIIIFLGLQVIKRAF